MMFFNFFSGKNKGFGDVFCFLEVLEFDNLIVLGLIK